MDIEDIFKKSKNDERLTDQELVFLLNFSPDSLNAYRVMAEANQKSKSVSGNTAEVHAQFSLNLSPCGCNCKFCSFSTINKVFDKESELTPEIAVNNSKLLENNGANAIFVMTTANYSFEKFLEISKEIRLNLKDTTVLIANIGDITLNQAKKIKDTGYNGVYHALRMREGVDTNIDPAQRESTIKYFQEVGLKVGTCVEPVGPEHTNEEIAEMINFTASLNPAFSGAMRRITIPGSPLEKYGMITELRMSQIVAVTRLGTAPYDKGKLHALTMPAWSDIWSESFLG